MKMVPTSSIATLNPFAPLVPVALVVRLVVALPVPVTEVDVKVIALDVRAVDVEAAAPETGPMEPPTTPALWGVSLFDVLSVAADLNALKV